MEKGEVFAFSGFLVFDLHALKRVLAHVRADCFELLREIALENVDLQGKKTGSGGGGGGGAVVVVVVVAVVAVMAVEGGVRIRRQSGAE